MKAAQAIARNTPVWVWHDGWWPALMVEPCSGTDETMLVVRLAHGVLGAHRAQRSNRVTSRS